MSDISLSVFQRAGQAMLTMSRRFKQQEEFAPLLPAPFLFWG
jgi:hypothetical protein